VDKLDGRDETDFLNASRVYQTGSLQLVPGDGGGKIAVLGATCDPGDIAISGGGNAIDPDDDLNAVIPGFHSYQVEFQDNGTPSNFKASVICSDNARPFR
jgi:hypothetical protein